jgi:hypothetical protein
MLEDPRAILGVDPTKRGLAFVVFEHGELIDWGTRRCGREPTEALSALNVLLRECATELLVLEDHAADGCLRRARIREFLRAARLRCRRRGIVVISVSRRQIRDGWRASGHTNKQAIAARLANDYPELLHLVPPPRRLFMDEDERLQIFDALTLVLALSDPTIPVGR